MGLDEEGTLQKKCRRTRRIARSNSGFCFPHERIVKINSDEKQAIFAHELQCIEAEGGIFENLF